MNQTTSRAAGVFLLVTGVSIFLVCWFWSFPEEYVPGPVYPMSSQVPLELEEAYQQHNNGDEMGKWLEEHGLLSIKPHLEMSGEL